MNLLTPVERATPQITPSGSMITRVRGAERLCLRVQPTTRAAGNATITLNHGLNAALTC